MQHTPYLEANTEVALTQRKLYHAGKRAFDVTLSLVALALLSPVCALVAALIKLDSAGPVFFRQTRLGLGGKPFTFYKFRTMQHNCDNNVHQNYVQALIRNEAPNNAGAAKVAPCATARACSPVTDTAGRSRSAAAGDRSAASGSAAMTSIERDSSTPNEPTRNRRNCPRWAQPPSAVPRSATSVRTYVPLEQSTRIVASG